MNQKQAIINALRVFVNQRPGFELGNYSTMTDYRSDSRKATKDKDIALQLLRDIELRDNITADAILREAQSGRLQIRTVSGCTPLPPVRVEYCTGQYFPTEYRPAVARLCASALWTWKRDHCMPLKEDGSRYETFGRAKGGGLISAGDWLRASFRREYGATIAARFFD